MLARVPTEDDLARAYWELARIGASSVGRKTDWPYAPESEEQLVALAADMARHDPRLLGVLVQLVLERWERWNPLALRREVSRMRWPQAFAVIGEFAREAGAPSELRFSLDYVCRGLRPLRPAEQFFAGLLPPGSRTARRAEGRNLKAYRRWGFVGWERPVVDPVRKRTVGRPERSTRRQILADLVERHGTIAVSQYLDAIDHAISRQQALSDLRSRPGLKRVGKGRGARWRQSS